MAFVPIGVDQTAAASLARSARAYPTDAIDRQQNRFDLEKYLSKVLIGASPLQIFDHGVGPFEDKALHFKPTNFGVLCVLSTPYQSTKADIENFLGRNAAMLAPGPDQPGCPIHIIMERPTSKTMDCYVELRTPEAAVDAYNKCEHMIMYGKHPKIGTRKVWAEVSNQDELLKALFPRARGLVWENGVPRKIPNNDPYSAGFQGFFTKEEVIGMQRHADMPQRSPYQAKCLQRTYECMISTLHKFPWHAQDMYTLEDRVLLFNCYKEMLVILVGKVAQSDTVGLDNKLLFEYVKAGINCAGFGERMRYEIAAGAGGIGETFGISMKSAAWPFDVLSIPFKAPDGGRWLIEHSDTVDFLMYLIQLGYDKKGDDYIHSDFIRVEPPGPPSNLPGEPVVTGVRFKFGDNVLDLSYQEIVAYETELMCEMLEVGFEKWKDDICVAWQQGFFNEDMQKDVNCLASLQQLDLYHGIGQMTLLEGLKGTVVEEEEEGDTTIRTRAGDDYPNVSRASNIMLSRIDPTVEPFEPNVRGNSEPSMAIPHETIITPVRAESVRNSTPASVSRTVRQNSALGVSHPDEPVVFAPVARIAERQSPIGTIGGQRVSVRRSPMRPRHTRGTVSVGQTIPEEHEGDGSEEEIMMVGRPRRSTDAGSAGL